MLFKAYWSLIFYNSRRIWKCLFFKRILRIFGDLNARIKLPKKLNALLEFKDWLPTNAKYWNVAKVYFYAGAVAK